CGVTTAGTAYCWGTSYLGQLGNGSIANSSTPVPVAGDLTFTSVSAGGNHTCGVTTGGAGYCWAAGDDGQLGNGTKTNSRTRVPVAGDLTFTSVSAGSPISGASYTYEHTCGLTTSGAAYCWGSNYLGQLGNGSTQDSSTPVAVSGELGFGMVS